MGEFSGRIGGLVFKTVSDKSASIEPSTKIRGITGYSTKIALCAARCASSLMVLVGNDLPARLEIETAKIFRLGAN